MNVFYVYRLFIENNNITIYVGKGKNKRMFQHKHLALKNKCENKKLERTILKVLKGGGNIGCEKLFENLSETEAHNKEKELIETIGLVNLCNLAPGGVGGDCLTNHPDYENICRKMGQTRKGKKRTKEELENIKRGKEEYFKSEKYKEWKEQRSKNQREAGKNNPLYKYITSETLEQKKERMKGVQRVSRWNKGLTKETSKILREESERRKNKIPPNAFKCKVKNNITDNILEFETLKDFETFLKNIYGTFNKMHLQYHLKGLRPSYRDFQIIEKNKYGKLTRRTSK
jgi:hypothetical protein